MQLTDALNSHLDEFIRMDVRIGRYTLPAFKLCGCTGLVLAIVLALTLTTGHGPFNTSRR